MDKSDSYFYPAIDSFLKICFSFVVEMFISTFYGGERMGEGGSGQNKTFYFKLLVRFYKFFPFTFGTAGENTHRH